MANDILNRGLPKWPQMLVTGDPVSTTQAKEIIRRTDSFFDWRSGNDHTFNALLDKAFGIFHKNEDDRFFGNRIPTLDSWRDQWGFIRTNYVHNRWIASSYIFGAHGWCHPDGTIFNEDNVGKWPSGIEVYEDWVALARAFPFLRVDVTLMSGEQCEDDRVPIMGFRIRNGNVEVVDPHTTKLHEGDSRWYRNEDDMWTKHVMTCGTDIGVRTNERPGHECGLTAATLLEYGEHARNMGFLPYDETTVRNQDDALRTLYGISTRGLLLR